MHGAVRSWSRGAARRARQAWRVADWLARPGAYGRPELAATAGPEALMHVVYSREIPIARADADAHPRFETGKRINLALAAPHFDGLLLAPDRPLSFWRVLGRMTAARGFAEGMELRAGCIVPALGGGICLLSNALFEMAARLGWTILERHGHSMEAVPAPADALWGLDATVAWPHVDLRVAPRDGDVRIAVRITGELLELAVYAASPVTPTVVLHATDDAIELTAAGRIRRNRIIRTIDGVPEQLSATAKRLLHSAERRRNCDTCDVHTCRDRPVTIGRRA